MTMRTALNDRIRHFYDRSTRIWLDTWGEHMHHGYYGESGTERKDHRQAQLDLIGELLRWGKVEKASSILDAGCGVGGSARHLAGLFDARVLGLTLSPVQAEGGAYYTKKAGLEDRVQIRVQDMMELSSADGPFDLVWSLESAEHIPDKKRLLETFFQVLAPGGKFLMATWCHRETPPELSQKEQGLLAKIYGHYHLPPMISIGEFKGLAGAAGFQEVQTADWTAAVAPFWPAVIRSAFRLRSLAALMRSGKQAIRGAWAMQFMTKGYREGIVRFGVIQGRKP